MDSMIKPLGQAGWHLLFVESLTETRTEVGVHCVGGETVSVRKKGVLRVTREYLRIGVEVAVPIAVRFGNGNHLVDAGSVDRNDVVEIGDDARLPDVKNVLLGGH